MNRFILNQEKNYGIKAIIPDELLIQEAYELPEVLGEYDVKKVMQNLSGRNISASDAVCFLGSGVYDHFVPLTVNKIAEYASMSINGSTDVGKSSGVLQAVYELQIFLQRLTGMKYINATLCGMSEALKKTLKIALANGKNKIATARSLNPEYKKLIKMLCFAYDLELVEIKCSNGDISKDEFLSVIDSKTLAVVQSPNHFGIIEDMNMLSDAAHGIGALFAAVTDPISLALLKSPGEYNADITVGNGQPLGGTLSYGSNSFAYMGLSEALKNYLSSGVVSLSDGKFKLDGTESGSYRLIQALTAAAYIGIMGTDGIKRVAEACASNAYYTYEKLTATSAFKPLFDKPFFREFTIKATKKNVNDINNRMLDYGMIGGVALKNEYPETGNAWLVAVTEKRSVDEIELFVKEASRSI